MPLQRDRHIEKRTDVCDRPAQFLIGHIQRTALGAPRLFIRADACYIEAFRNWLIQNASGCISIFFSHLQFDPSDKVRSEPIQANQVVVDETAFDSCRLETSLRH